MTVVPAMGGGETFKLATMCLHDLVEYSILFSGDFLDVADPDDKSVGENCAVPLGAPSL